ncbi:hypothetical protein BDK51DRAFT_34351 [Blyttiomyces helicus]|uniref:Uncharacterized protein n=1 Tax=Blyttiomyces helicus TaxID=388810 RepID=A0A4P9WR10_9FUNG|nr:hypothetical protein BDK51DRAFT_34351 [Blyttiomyces helicus]|eukprot:RKO94845.1 hypothetical protein BDK51DRAFT_34351 [Blyttiomyces helicus]
MRKLPQLPIQKLLFSHQVERQLEIINYAIQTLASETWKDPEMINFQALHDNVITYHDIDGKQAENHDWRLVSDDVTFKPLELPQNRFKEFENYFQSKAGASKNDMKTDFENYGVVFQRLRDGLIKIMAKSCVGDSSSPEAATLTGGGRRDIRHNIRELRQRQKHWR